MYKKTLFCLANSSKPGGSCVAGKEMAGVNAGKWIRPVSSRVHREISDLERRCKGGGQAQLLDIVTIPFRNALPESHQHENHLVVENEFWVKEGQANWEQVKALVDPFDANFWIGGQNTIHGLNDKLGETLAVTRESSLKLLAIPRLQIEVNVEEGYKGSPPRRRVRGRFTYEGRVYLLSVTDVEIETAYLRRGPGSYNVSDVVMCVSLAEVWKENHFAFRVIASVITEARLEGNL